MQNVSAVYEQIRDSMYYYVESALIICDNTILPDDDYLDEGHASLNPDYFIGEDDILSIKTNRSVFSSNVPEVGCCTCGEIELEIYKPNRQFPTMARITPYTRLVSSEDESVKSEWIRKGVYFIDFREMTKNDDHLSILTLHGYDSMLKANDAYPSSSLSEPTDIEAIQEIADAIGVDVDERTYEVMRDVSDTRTNCVGTISYDMIEVLGYIAALYGGNFIINDLGKLQLIPLWNLPEETSLLTDEDYIPLTFGVGANKIHILLGVE